MDKLGKLIIYKTEQSKRLNVTVNRTRSLGRTFTTLSL